MEGNKTMDVAVSQDDLVALAPASRRHGLQLPSGPSASPALLPDASVLPWHMECIACSWAMWGFLILGHPLAFFEVPVPVKRILRDGERESHLWSSLKGHREMRDILDMAMWKVLENKVSPGINSIVLKFQYLDFVILNRYSRPDKTHEGVAALKINLFIPLPWYCAVESVNICIECLSMASGGMVGDDIPGLHALGIITVLGLSQTGFQRHHSFQESLESVNQRDSTSTKNEVCALGQSKGCTMEFNHGRDLSNVALVVSEERIHSHEDVSRWFAKSVLTDLAPWACVSLGFVPDAKTEEDPRTGQHWKVVVLN
ncbi:hypothetical protein TURU_163802 [Turdus rufiventris]|nr:hypothetical protein TURU_163802 [Turdus rufiventris]